MDLSAYVYNAGVLLFAIFCGTSFIYWHWKKNLNYWNDRGIPQVPAVPFLGSIFDVFKGVMHDVDMERSVKYGKLFGYYEGERPALMISDPSLLRDIFVKDFQYFSNRRDLRLGDPIADVMVSILQGEDWKRVRTLITPAFTTGRLKKMTGIIADSAKTLAENFDKHVDSNEYIEGKKMFGAFAMDVIASSAFATKIDSHNDPNNPFVTVAKQAFRQPFPWRFFLFIVFPRLMRVLGISVFPPRASGFFKTVTLKIIEERRRTGSVHNDFLQLLMDAADRGEESINGSAVSQKIDEDEDQDVKSIGIEEGNEKYFKQSGRLKSLSNNELIAQCVLFFLAGYDTTASTLSFVSYFLATNPECQEKLIAEIDETMKNNQEITYEAIQSMKYLDNVILETLRFYSPAIRNERVCEAEYKLGDTGLTLEKGTLVVVPVYTIHHDSENYEDPEKFNPDRFLPEERARRNAYTYLPFGAGPRNCVGMRFALMEIKICLVYTLSRFRFKTCPKTQIPIEFMKAQGLLQPKSIMLAIERRTDSLHS